MYLTIRNQSRHQPLVGNVFEQDSCKVNCLAAHGDAVLVLRYDTNGEPLAYIVCHRPEVDSNGRISWGAGDYFTILNYQHCGHSDPISAAFSDAVRILIASHILAFRFEPIEGEPEAVELLVSVSPPPSYEQYHEIADCIAFYIESIPTFSYTKCVEDVMNSFPHFSYRILQPDHTLHI